jgi:ABC-2 type transport system ATP-binding protein
VNRKYTTPEVAAPSAIAAVALVKRYGDLAALDGLDLTVGEGELYGFLGPNGAGKTTAIRIMTGTARATSGTVSVGGVDVTRDPVAAKSHIGVVSQHVNLDADLTVRENLELHGLLHGMPSGERKTRIVELLKFAELSDRSGSLAKTLSGGMKRKLTIVRALMHRPRILFLDEPTTGLDAASRRRMWDLVRSIHREGVTVFLTTHYIEEAEALCGRVGILNKGRLIDEGAPAALINALGPHAVDHRVGGETETRYFPTREEAVDFLAHAGPEAAVRATNLEDLFIQKTGRRVST